MSGTKALRCSGPPRVAGFEKKPDGVLMQRVNARTEQTRSLIHGLKLRPVWASKKRHITLPVPFHLCFIRHIKTCCRDMWRRESCGEDGEVRILSL